MVNTASDGCDVCVSPNVPRPLNFNSNLTVVSSSSTGTVKVGSATSVADSSTVLTGSPVALSGLHA